MKRLLSVLLLSVACLAQPLPQISPERIRADVRFLSHDLLEGRGVGTRGGDLAAEYIATQFELAGLKPAGDNGTFFQRVPLVGVDPQPNSTLGYTAKGAQTSWRYLDEFVGVTDRQQPQVAFEGEAIFAGHGISAPEFQWDDFKGVDLKGKVLILFTNEPTSTDPKFFGGAALTYYGRWTYKFEEATRRGALACILIHTTPTAGYGWKVVRNSWGKESPQVRLAPGAQALAMAGWISQEAGEKLLATSGHSIAELLKAAEQRDFRPFSLGIRIAGKLNSKLRDIESKNVVGMVRGGDSRLAPEAIVFSAHWDHLGIGTPVNGDSIYNGAVDNATGCGILIELARAWAALPQKPRRSAIFLSVTAEESGLLGSEFYGRHPIVPAGKTAINLNYDAILPEGRLDSIEVAGSERTTAYPLVEQVAKRMNLLIRPDAEPGQGSFYRSDHFSMARAGIPAFTIHAGPDYSGKPASFAEEARNRYRPNYHQPSDEFRDSWDFSGLAQLARFGMAVGMDVANTETLPTWQPGDEFLAAREASGVR